MDNFGHDRHSDIHFDKEWISIAILLAIPHIRVIGVFLLLKKMRAKFHLRGASCVLMYVAAFMILTGGIWELIEGISSALIPFTVVVLAIIAAMSVFKRNGDKLDDYVSCIGSCACYDIDVLMNEMGVNEKRLRKDISTLKKKGMIPKSAYIDEGHRLLVLRPEGKPEPASRPRPAAQTEAQKPQEEPMTEEEREYREIILEIRALNIAIDDEKVSQRIDRIEEITSNIFHLVQQRPEHKKDIQTFMEYYLPTTLKLLRHYARLEQQPVTGENIASSRHRIEAILDKLVVSFEQQLDVLFKSEAHDITTDIKVLEKMMQMDGLG